MKKWYTETRRIDTETGEILTESRIKRENWIYTKKIDEQIQDCGGYTLKIINKKYEKNRQLRLEL